MKGDIGIGRIIKEERHRDAIHIAVAPIEALCELKPGERICIHEGKALIELEGKAVGIVDPFLTGEVEPGQRFWLVLYPGTITGLRHVWTHPAFTMTAAAVKERLW